MDQITFSRLMGEMAKRYYSTPRSTEVPTPRGPMDLRDMGDAFAIWAVEDFGAWVKDGDDRTQRERMK